MVARVFDDGCADLDPQGGLDFVAFKKFIATTPDLMQMMESVMARHDWSSFDAKEKKRKSDMDVTIESVRIVIDLA
jgi:hypothetical protein